jgi:hypothetical protein
VAVSLFDGSAALVATTWQVLAVDGAVYTPPCVTEPQPLASTIDQVTASLVVPATLAVNGTEPPTVTEVVCGETMTRMVGVVVTVTVASACTDESAALVARTWNVPVEPGAVYSPVAVTVPPPDSTTDQVTVVIAVPVAVEANVIDSSGSSSTSGGWTLNETVWAPPPLVEPVLAALQAARSPMLNDAIQTDDRRGSIGAFLLLE